MTRAIALASSTFDLRLAAGCNPGANNGVWTVVMEPNGKIL
jgi:hypothetical protein